MITYCSNIHPGESFGEIFSNLQACLPPVKEAVCPKRPFPIGLRLSNQAAMEVDERVSARFGEWCRENGFFVPTINGFPYGPFNFVPVKENAYLPDWRSEERVAYTNKLGSLLDSWMPLGITGSISTVPLGFRSHLRREDYPLVRRNLIRTLEWLDGLKQKSGKVILLALEPEPACILETIGEVISFFSRLDLPQDLMANLALCYDCCHQAVQFESPSETLTQLAEAGIKIAKVQVSSALRLRQFEKKILEGFCEPSYLHQVTIRRKDGSLLRFTDLPEALNTSGHGKGEEWRVHFHVPIFADKMGTMETTRFFLEEILPLIPSGVLLEVETYSWHVLPRELQLNSVMESIIRELQWLKGQLHEADGCS